MPFPCLLALLVSAAYAAPAVAEISDTFHPYVAATYVHDDNMLRLSEGETYNGERSDNYRRAVVGLQIDYELGRQKFSADLSGSHVAFDRFDTFDYNGKDAQALWEWQLGNRLTGHLGGSYSQTLAPFSDFNSVGVSGRNLRVQRREFVDANWLFHPSWQVHGGLTRYQYRYDLSTQTYNNRDEDTSELGVDYLTSGGSRIGLQARRIKGTYPNGTLQGFLVSDDYVQNEVKLNIFWKYSAITQVQFLGGGARREHAVYGNRDQSGTNGRLVVFWSPRSKLKFTGNAWREFTAVEGSGINSALSKGASLDAAWQATSKVSLTTQLRNERRDFSTLVAAATADPHDQSRSATLSLTYAPQPNVELTTGYSHSKREGNFEIGSGNYTSNSVSFSAQIIF